MLEVLSSSFSSATPCGGVAPATSSSIDSVAADAYADPAFSPPPGPRGSVQSEGGVTVITHRQVPRDVLDHKLWFHVFASRSAKSGREFSGTAASLIPFLTSHAVGTKDGTAIVAGVKKGDHWYGEPPLPGCRPFFPRATRDRLKDAALTRMTMMCLDLDKGDDGVEIIRRVKDAGFFAVLTPSFSHLSVTETDLSQEKLEAHAGHGAPFSLEEALAFLVRVEGFNPTVLENAELVGEVVKGKKKRLSLRVRHSPLQKYRLIAPLVTPWHVPPGLSEKDASEPWGNLMRGLAHRLGVVLDESTVDLQRLFFVPRRPEGREVTTHIIGGHLLDWRTIDPVERVTEAKAKVVKKTGRGAAKRRAADRGVDSWVRDYRFYDPTIPARLKARGRSFNLVRFMLSQGFEVRAGSPERGGWVSFRCPNADEHSEDDTPGHTSFYCASPDATYPTQAMCFHDHCRSLGVPEFVDLIFKEQEAGNV